MTQYTYSDELISDLHKDAYGFRPSEGFWVRWEQATPDEKQAEWDSLVSEMERTFQEQKAEQAEAVVRFGRRVQEVIDSGARDRETALRWIMEADECDGDWEYLCYRNGLPYGFFRKAA